MRYASALLLFLPFALAGACGGRLSASPAPSPDQRDASVDREDLEASLLDALSEAPADVVEAAVDAHPECTFLGVGADAFETLTGPDGCSCMCLPGGAITCSGLACESDAGLMQCDYFGTTHPVDDHWECSDGCNDCYCDAPGLWATTTMVCSPSTVCVVDGATIPQGMHMLAPDGCNLCTCWGDGAVSCTSTWFCLP